MTVTIDTEPADRAGPGPDPADRGRGRPQRARGHHDPRRGRGPRARPGCSGCWCRPSSAGTRPTWSPRSRCSRSWPTPTARPAGRPWPTPPRRASPPSTPATRRWRPCSAPAPGIHAGHARPDRPGHGGRRRLSRCRVATSSAAARGHADWLGAGVMEMVDGEPARERARPARHAGRASCPASAGRVPGQLGRHGPGRHRQLRLRGRRRRRARGRSRSCCSRPSPSGAVPGYGIGLFGLTAIGHAGFALGVGHRALDEVLAIARPSSGSGPSPSPSSSSSCTTSPCTTRPCGRPGPTSTSRSPRPRRPCSTSGMAVARTAAAHAPGHDLRHPDRRRRRPLRLHVGRVERAAQPERGAALLPRHPRRHAAPLRRQQHAHRVHRRLAWPPAEHEPTIAPGSTRSTRSTGSEQGEQMSDEISAEPTVDHDVEPGRRSRPASAWPSGCAAVLPDGAEPEVLDVTAPESNGMSSETLLFDAVWTERRRAASPRAGGPGRARRQRRARVPELRLRDASSGSCSWSASTLTDVPVPGVRWLELDPAAIGAPFFVMDRVEGRVPPDNMPYPMGSWLLDADPADQRALQDASVRGAGRHPRHRRRRGRRRVPRARRAGRHAAAPPRGQPAHVLRLDARRRGVSR